MKYRGPVVGSRHEYTNYWKILVVFILRNSSRAEFVLHVVDTAMYLGMYHEIFSFDKFIANVSIFL